MEKTYEYQNGVIYVVLPESCDQEIFKKVTTEFLKKVISEERKNGNNNPSRDFREK